MYLSVVISISSAVSVAVAADSAFSKSTRPPIFLLSVPDTLSTLMIKGLFDVPLIATEKNDGLEIQTSSTVTSYMVSVEFTLISYIGSSCFPGNDSDGPDLGILFSKYFINSLLFFNAPCSFILFHCLYTESFTAMIFLITYLMIVLLKLKATAQYNMFSKFVVKVTVNLKL